MAKDRKRWRLPPYRVEAKFDTIALAETVDWGLALNHVPELWKQTEGQGITVAVLDDGVDFRHSDLAPNIAGSMDFTGFGLSPGEHGTHVAGTVAAARNEAGVVGVAPKARILNGKVLHRGSGSMQAVAMGIRWALNQGADVISMSLGGPVPDQAVANEIQKAALAGVFVVCAAGNDGRDNSVNYPAAYDFVVAVGSVDRNGRLSAFSSRGHEVDICAPGQDITSTWLDGTYAKLSGTSMATPFVSGVVALMLSKHRQHGGQTPIKTIHDLLEHLQRTAKDAGPQGKDPHYGFGLIDPESVIGKSEPPVEPEEKWVPTWRFPWSEDYAICKRAS